jgi:prepilin-type N-terminal cleavage/methylation domain-containing protein
MPAKHIHISRPDCNRIARGFTLVELLVVIAIIAILIGILMPSLSRAQQSAQSAVCLSNLRQIGLATLAYADDNDGWLFPTGMGWDAQHVYYDSTLGLEVYNVWTTKVFTSWNPAVMLCPCDFQPDGDHSYVMNEHLGYWNVKYSTGLPYGVSPSSVVLSGEKVSTVYDYYMEYGDFDRVVDQYRHGVKIGSNYLFLDMHAESELPAQAKLGLDPWDFANGITPPTPVGNGS